MKAEPSGAQKNAEVRVHAVRLAAGVHNNYCSEELGDYCRTTSMFHFPLHCRYPRGFVASVQTIPVERIKRVHLRTVITSFPLISLLLSVFGYLLFVGMSCTCVIAPIDATRLLLLTTQLFVWISCTQSRHELVYYHSK